VESARLIGAYRWVESRLFEALGSWVADVGVADVRAADADADADAKVMLASHSREHAWHAELWAEQLPTAGEMEPEGLTMPANPGVAALFEAMSQSSDEHLLLGRLAGAYRVLLPRMIAAYSAHLGMASAVADGPVVRVLRLILRDEVEGWVRDRKSVV
jgi:hypothetical protein